MKVKVTKWGNSLGVRLPKAAAEAVGAREGTELDLVVSGNWLVMRIRSKTSWELLDEMIAEARRLGPDAEPTAVEWGPDRGSEIIDDDNPY